MTFIFITSRLGSFRQWYARGEVGAAVLPECSRRPPAKTQRHLSRHVPWFVHQLPDMVWQRSCYHTSHNFIQIVFYPMGVRPCCQSQHPSLFANPLYFPQRSWNEWVSLPIKYCDIPRNSLLCLSIYECCGPGKYVAVGGTTLPLFGKLGVYKQVTILKFASFTKTRVKLFSFFPRVCMIWECGGIRKLMDTRPPGLRPKWRTAASKWWTACRNSGRGITWEECLNQIGSTGWHSEK